VPNKKFRPTLAISSDDCSPSQQGRKPVRHSDAKAWLAGMPVTMSGSPVGLKHEHWKEKDAETFFGKELSQKQLRAKREVKPLPYMRRTPPCVHLSPMQGSFIVSGVCVCENSPSFKRGKTSACERKRRMPPTKSRSVQR